MLPHVVHAVRGQSIPQRFIFVRANDRVGKRLRILGDEHVLAGYDVHALDRDRCRNNRQAITHRHVDLALDASAVAQRRDRNAAAVHVRRDVLDIAMHDHMLVR